MSEMDKLRKMAQEYHDMKKLVRKQAKKIKTLEVRIDWALRCNRSGMVGFVPSLLHSLDDLDYHLNNSDTLRDYIEATERESRICPDF